MISRAPKKALWSVISSSPSDYSYFDNPVANWLSPFFGWSMFLIAARGLSYRRFCERRVSRQLVRTNDNHWPWSSKGGADLYGWGIHLTRAAFHTWAFLQRSVGLAALVGAATICKGNLHKTFRSLNPRLKDWIEPQSDEVSLSLVEAVLLNSENRFFFKLSKSMSFSLMRSIFFVINKWLNYD